MHMRAAGPLPALRVGRTSIAPAGRSRLSGHMARPAEPPAASLSACAYARPSCQILTVVASAIAGGDGPGFLDEAGASRGQGEKKLGLGHTGHAISASSGVRACESDATELYFETGTQSRRRCAHTSGICALIACGEF